MTKEQILEIEPDFQKLIDSVVYHNTSGRYKNWYDVWGRAVKPLNDTLRIVGWEAKDERLRNTNAFDSAQRILENLTTLP